ncbi:hypothetical protein Scep_007331 [Stephania cephalantha]|uniref:Uncharacterized protein n=1 Tax=Stephania cephalantha TaxID=152367 RepID=A0AAP0KBD7_9MAGN
MLPTFDFHSVSFRKTAEHRDAINSSLLFTVEMRYAEKLLEPFSRRSDALGTLKIKLEVGCSSGDKGKGKLSDDM